MAHAKVYIRPGQNYYLTTTFSRFPLTNQVQATGVTFSGNTWKFGATGEHRIDVLMNIVGVDAAQSIRVELFNETTGLSVEYYDFVVEVLAGGEYPCYTFSTNVTDATQDYSIRGKIMGPNKAVVCSASITIDAFSSADTNSIPTSSNKHAAASTTTSDNQTTGVTIAATPASDGYVMVMVNGVQVELGNGVKTKDCYFSVDGGTTARAIAAIAAGDTLYWNGSIAGFQLTSGVDYIDLNYDV